MITKYSSFENLECSMAHTSSFSRYLIGSHQYGMATEGSDKDLLGIFFNIFDHLALLPHHEDDYKFGDNSQSGVKLQKFLKLVIKGNPNYVETLFLTPQVEHGPEGLRFTDWLFPNITEYVVTRQLAFSYWGHLHNLQKELAQDQTKDPDEKKKLTNKRVAHFWRVFHSLEHLLEEGTMPEFAKMPQCVEVRGIKEGTVWYDVNNLIAAYNEYPFSRVEELAQKLPDHNDKLRTAVMVGFRMFVEDWIKYRKDVFGK